MLPPINLSFLFMTCMCRNKKVFKVIFKVVFTITLQALEVTNSSIQRNAPRDFEFKLQPNVQW